MRFLQILMILVLLSVSCVLPLQSGRLLDLIQRQKILAPNELELDDPLEFQKLFYRPRKPKDSGEGYQRYYGNLMRYGR
ncbi:unnamed protein product [Schistosoma guineensis]|uniref:Neuropeptide-Like Protein n=3 Tax=Schistosoma TaxID=6181 RepID=A0AA85B589_9TREM|nr:unnamed protein product [Schistosoma mattheei]CAH8447357.1 unnamed protein product [Schistosoma intercalatum]CAH8447894.1 unnamed protein product [Schistosoma guineensis]CAH8450457.1 unnamed protein product [Schistosoma curassoni]CAH8473216.1 unnamed protein product [Schistosoma bovis]